MIKHYMLKDSMGMHEAGGSLTNRLFSLLFTHSENDSTIVYESVSF